MGRLSLQTLLEELLQSRNVYYQPPSSVSMKYPAIKFEKSNIQQDFANDKPYIRSDVYNITVIDEDPDSPIVDKVSKLLFCSFDRHYISNNLNHTVFKLYYK